MKLVIALLIFTSPAELGLATPLVTIAAIARAAKEGILVKGGKVLEELTKVNTIVFDKTGTLTIGRPSVVRMEIIHEEFSEQQAIEYAAATDRRSGHPLAKAILEFASQRQVNYGEPEDFEVVRGRGVKATVAGKKILLGNKEFLNENRVTTSATIQNEKDTAIFLSVDGKAAAIFFVADAIRPNAKKVISELKSAGVTRIVMLTGDNEQTAKAVSGEVGISEFKANLLPENKIDFIKQFQDAKERVAMVGDGINDAPALVQANVGIAMGAMGTQAAMEAADIVLMEDKIEKIARARAISRRALRTIKENIIVGVGVVHVTGIILVLLRILGPVEAAAIHLLPDTLVFINSIKLLRVKIS